MTKDNSALRTDASASSRGLKKAKQPKELLRDALDASLEVELEIDALRELARENDPAAIEAAQLASTLSGFHDQELGATIDRKRMEMHLQKTFTFENRTYTSMFWHPSVAPTVNELRDNAMYGNGLHMVERKLVRAFEADDAGKKSKKGKGGSDGGSGGGGDDWVEKEVYTLISGTPVFANKIIKDDRGELFLEVSFPTLGGGGSGKWETVLIKFSQLLKSGSQIWSELSKHGLIVSQKKQALFTQMADDLMRLASYSNQGYREYVEFGVSRPGWHWVSLDGHADLDMSDEVPRELHYITAGFSTTSKVRYTGNKSSLWQQKGNESLYLKRMVQMMRWNPTVYFLAGFNTAGYLISHLGLDHNPIFAVVGETSIGKTTLLETVLSTRGQPELLMKTMDGTEKGLNAYVIQCNDAPATLDEIGSQDTKMSEQDKQKQLYVLGAGKPRTRLYQSGLTGEFEPSGETPKSHYTLMLTGEKNLIDHNKAQGGNMVRLNSFVFNRDTNPLWLTLDGINAPVNTDIEDWSNFVDENHGWLAPRLIVQIKNHLERYKEAYRRFQKCLSKDLGVGAEARKSNGFAAALTGCLVLHDVLAEVFDDKTQEMVEGLRWRDMGAASRRAKELMAQSMENAPVESEGERFEQFIDQILFKYNYQLHQVSMTGEITYATQTPLVGQRKEYPMHYELAIEKSTLSAIAQREQNLSPDRFLRWAETNGIYEKTVDSNGVSRTTKRVKVNGHQLNCYVFRIKKEIPPGPDGKPLPLAEEGLDNVINSTAKSKR